MHAVLVLALAGVQSTGAGAGGEWEVASVAAAEPTDQFNLEAWLPLGDANGDGTEDVVVILQTIFDGIQVARFDGGAPTAAWRVSWSNLAPTPGDDPGWLERLTDLDGDGVAEILVGPWRPWPSPGFYAVLSGADGSVIHHSARPAEYFGYGASGAPVGDIDLDGTDDYVIAAQWDAHGTTSTLLAHSGATHAVLWELDTVPAGLGSASAVAGLHGADYDADGCADFAVSANGRLHAISARTAAVVHDLGSYAYVYAEGSEGIGVLDDLDGDGLQEIVVRSGLGRTCVSSATSTALWWTSGVESYSSSTAAVPDVDGDGFCDCVFGVPDLAAGGTPNGGRLAIHSGVDGAFLRYVRGGARNTQGGNLGWHVGALADGGPGIVAYQWGGPNGAPGSTVQFAYDPFLASSADTVSAAVGGTISLQAEFPLEHAGEAYAALFSWAGFGPTALGSRRVPLTPDALYWKSIDGKLPSAIQAARGALDANARATVDLQAAPGALTSLVGRRLHAAVVTVDLTARDLTRSSAGVGILIEP